MGSCALNVWVCKEKKVEEEHKEISEVEIQ